MDAWPSSGGGEEDSIAREEKKQQAEYVHQSIIHILTTKDQVYCAYVRLVRGCGGADRQIEVGIDSLFGLLLPRDKARRRTGAVRVAECWLAGGLDWAISGWGGVLLLCCVLSGSNLLVVGADAEVLRCVYALNLGQNVPEMLHTGRQKVLVRQSETHSGFFVRITASKG